MHQTNPTLRRFMTKEHLETACSHVLYHLIESINDADYVPPDLYSFPGGSCELTSYWLCILLNRIGFKNVMFCNGSRQLAHEDLPKNHVWLHVENCYYVDITGYQFDNCNTSIVIEESLPSYLRDFKPFRKYPLEEANAACMQDSNYNAIWQDLNKRLSA